MANWAFVTKTHRFIYRTSGGRIGARLGGLDMLLLTTVGRRSGQLRTLPLACFADGADLIVVASNGGSDRHPAWWLNLQKTPEAGCVFGRDERRVRAALANEEEHARLWPWLKECNPMYAKYEERTDRPNPVVILRTIEA
jgi:deazaflavin-dependent oxidoreductase (nitroreductase family)